MNYTFKESLETCRNCRIIFRYMGFGEKYCPSCKKADDEEFKIVKDYLWDNPGRTLIQTSDDCNVTTDKIRKWLREERLEYVTVEGSGLTCDRCGTQIRSGMFCDDCKHKMVGSLEKMMEKPKPLVVEKVKPKDTKVNKMHFMHA